MGEGADIGVLDHVLGLAVVAQDAAGEAEQPAIVGLHDGADRGLVTGQRALHEVGVARADRRNGRCLGLAHGGIILIDREIMPLDAHPANRFPEKVGGWPKIRWCAVDGCEAASARGIAPAYCMCEGRSKERPPAHGC